MISFEKDNICMFSSSLKEGMQNSYKRSIEGEARDL